MKTNNGSFDDRCGVCNATYDFKQVAEILTEATADLARMGKSDDETCIDYIEKYSKYLSKDHYLLTEVRISLAQVIGQNGQMPRISDSKLYLKLDTAMNLIKLIQKLAPGTRTL